MVDLPIFLIIKYRATTETSKPTIGGKPNEDGIIPNTRETPPTVKA